MRIADTRLLYDLGPTRKIGTKTTKKNNYFIASNEHIITNSSACTPENNNTVIFRNLFYEKRGR